MSENTETPLDLRALERAAESGDTMYGTDFLLTWELSEGQLLAIVAAAEALRQLYERGASCRVFESGLAVSLFRDNSTRTRFSFASAANLLGLTVQDLDESKSQLSHGETVRETANMISFLTEIIGVRDDKYLGAGHTYMRAVGAALDEGHAEGVLHQRPGIVNLQCDVDHPTQSMADLLHLKRVFGSLEDLRGRKLAMTWAYSPSYGKPLSVPQGIVALMTRFGMDVTLAYPEGYELLGDCLDVAQRNAEASGGRFTVSHSMDEAFEGAEVVYPKSWAPFDVMQRRTGLRRDGDIEEVRQLEADCLATNARHLDWECTEDRMRLTRGGAALYMHCLPADITGVSCAAGEVAKSVFERCRLTTYHEASFKPFVIAAAMLLNRFEDPAGVLRKLAGRGRARKGGQAWLS